MNKQTEIKINRLQLNVLLNNEQKDGFDYLLNQGVFCSTCEGTCEKGIEIKDIYILSCPPHKQHICKSHKPTHHQNSQKSCFFANHTTGV